MVEFAPVGQNIYRRGFARDTLNTCWHIAQIIRDRGEVGYFAKVEIDAPSAEFLHLLSGSGIGSEPISNCPIDAIDRPLC